MGEMRCSPVHDGPFFYERTDVYRCEGCRGLVTRAQVASAASALQGNRDGNDLQREQSLPRACDRIAGQQRPFRT